MKEKSDWNSYRDMVADATERLNRPMVVHPTNSDYKCIGRMYTDKITDGCIEAVEAYLEEDTGFEPPMVTTESDGVTYFYLRLTEKMKSILPEARHNGVFVSADSKFYDFIQGWEYNEQWQQMKEEEKS